MGATDRQRHIDFHAQDVPNAPGVYVFRSDAGAVIYVGKAKSLRRRLRNYFQPSRKLTADPKLRSLIHSIASYETITVRSEAEALLLESRLIKQYAPRYNVDLRDDKRFLLIRVDPTEPFPRLRLVRVRTDDNCLHFGPFPHAGALRGTVDFLVRRFGLRSCGASTRPGPADYRHCLKDVLKDCTRPCTGGVSEAEYRQRLEAALDVLRGRARSVLSELEAAMKSAAQRRRFEEAARFRDVLRNLQAQCAPGRRSFERAVLPRPGTGPAQVLALQQALGLDRAPSVIECFDISNISGRFAVGSMVCFRDGKPATNDYRRYRIRTVEGVDDFAMIREIVRRRYGRLLKDRRPLPDLIVIDGGPGQVNSAMAALSELNCPPVPLLGLAKKQEHIYLPGAGPAVALPRTHPALKLLQSLRDEAHRFAISYHRDLRRRRISNSVLSEIAGIGPKRRQALLQAFGSVQRLRCRTPAEIAEAVPGLGMSGAARVCEYLHRHNPKPASEEIPPPKKSGPAEALSPPGKAP
ncbi:MAG: excinuclease ABC subunit UvrC [Kiritimatiellaeota bacterium]|nr:excinuclease ABC subunit UvrC [Kiritimatiellota bacterium]